MPNLVSAVATGLRTVRITFSAALADATSLEPSNWALVCLGAPPFFVPVIGSIVGVDSQTIPSQIDLTTTSEFSPGLLYSATCTGVTGVVAPNNVGLFYALTPITFADRDFALIDVMPAINVREDTTGQLANFIACLQEPLTLLLNDVDRFADIFDPDLAPPQFVDAMLEDQGNPFTFLLDLTLAQKRKLVKLLLPIYQLKGTVPGMVEAIRLLMGFGSQFFPFNSLGLLLGVDYLGAGGSPFDPGTWILGAGAALQFFVKIATTPTGNGLGANGPGRALTSAELGILTQIINVMKPAGLLRAFLESGLFPSTRATIKDNGAGSVTINCLGIPTASVVTLWEGVKAGVQEFNGTAQTTVAGTKTYTPAGVRYWVGSGTNPPDTAGEGLYSNEVTNALTAPALAATPGPADIEISWSAIVGATSYRIYKSASAAGDPSGADNAATPIEIYADETSYIDRVNSGDQFFYIVTPVIDDSEGFYSNEVNATAL